MALNGLTSVLRRNQFYWSNYKVIVFSFIMLLINVFLLFGLALYQRSAYPTPNYFGTTPDGRPILVVPLTEPYQTTDNVQKWAAAAILNIYSYDFVTWRKSLQDCSLYFTQKGYWDFLAALKDSTNLEAVKTLKQVVTAEVKGPAVLLREGQLNAHLPYSWDLQLPVMVTYQNSENNVIKQTGLVVMRVERDSTLRHPDGLAIAQLVMQVQ
jgi:intracellular multiplication protein IcmL